MMCENNIKFIEVKRRKMEVISKEELKEWKRLFSLFGFKKDCFRETGVRELTVKRILKDGKGLESTVSSIRGYCEQKANIIKNIN